MTHWNQVCDLLLGHNPPVGKQCFRAFWPIIQDPQNIVFYGYVNIELPKKRVEYLLSTGQKFVYLWAGFTNNTLFTERLRNWALISVLARLHPLISFAVSHDHNTNFVQVWAAWTEQLAMSAVRYLFSLSLLSSHPKWTLLPRTGLSSSLR